MGPEAKKAISYEEKIWAEDPYAGGCPVAYGIPGTDFAFPQIRLPFRKLVLFTDMKLYQRFIELCLRMYINHTIQYVIAMLLTNFIIAFT